MNLKSRHSSYRIVLGLLFVLLYSTDLFAACGGNLYVWDSGGGNDNWNTTANWNPNGEPNGTGDDARIIAGQRDTQINQNRTIGCMDVVSGFVTDRNSRRLTVTGDYFKAHTSNTIQFDSTSFWLEMAGTSAQTLEIVDRIRNLEISNDTSVTFTKSFEIYRQLTFAPGWTGTLYIEDDLFYNTATAMTIPSGGTVVIRNGATVTTFANWTINGTLRIEPGSSLRPGEAEVITVSSTGSLILAGASGNPAILSSQDISDRFTFNMYGIFNGEYFQVSRTTAIGMNTTGTIQKMDSGEFHYITANGYAMTLSSAVTLPSTMNTVGFYNDASASNVRNINASAYNGSATTVNDWSGSVGGSANENDTNGKIAWGTQAGIKLTLVDNSDPAFTINQNTTATMANFSFALNQAGTSTDITQVKISQISTASSTDIAWIDVYRDASASRNCLYNGGVDVSITGQVSLSGSPPSYTVTIPAGDVSTSSDTDAYCIHVRARTTSTAQDEKYIQFSIQSTGDVVNSQGYPFSTASSPPVTASPAIRINGDPVRIWEGSSTVNWNTAGNWTGGIPTNTNDCQVGVGQRVTRINLAQARCQNATLLSGGTIDFNNTSNEFAVYSGLDVQTGYNFLNTAAGPGEFAMRGSASQNLSMRTEFPGDLLVANTGAAGNDIVSVNADSIISGDVVINNGVLRITNPSTLTVRGDLTCQTGAELEIMPGATLKMGDASTLTIDSGCTFTIVGSTTENATITSDAGASDYNVVVNGTIEARYYSFDHLSTSGVSIESGATINTTNHLQDGTFSYPVNNSSTLLRLKQQVPTNTLNDMTFSLGGSAATGSKNIDTTGVSAGTLTLDSYTGDLSGVDYDTDPVYLLSWLGATNTIDLTQEATSPASLDAGSTYNMGRFGFEQTLAGVSYVDTDITSVKITLTGTASSNDISDVKLFYDDNCDGSAGSLLGSGSLTGNPASRTFSISAGAATVEADNTSTPKRCLYVEYVIDAGATDGNTAGVKITASADVSNSQGYAINSSTLPPIDLGSSGTITGANETIWEGNTNTNWFTASNWSAGVPDSDKTCRIDSSTNNPNINGGSGTAVCKSVIIGNGILTLQNSTSAVLEIYGSYENTGTLTQNDGTIRLRDDGATPTNQGVKSDTTINSLTFNKTAGGEVYVNSTNITISNLTFPGSSDFDFRIPNSKILTLPSSTTLVDASISIDAGGILKMGNSTTLTVNSGAKLKMVGTSANLATMTSSAGSSAYNLVINGEIQARYYAFDHLNTNGVSIESGAIINTTDPMQNGEFTYPVNNGTTLLKLKRKVPTDSINSIKFDLAGSSATGSKNIDTTGAASGTLSINSFVGDLGGPSFDIDPSYIISWSGAQNTIDLTQEATGPGGVNANTTYVMGRFGFKQTQAGASYASADLTSLKLTLTGTGTSSDIEQVRIYYDSDCDSASGTQIGSGTFSGSPASITFPLSAGQATVQADASTPPKRCIYVEYDIAAGAIDANTVGVQIAANSHIANDQGYNIADATPAPVTLGTAASITGSTLTTWDGSTSTDWFTASNWSGGVPDSTKNCSIDDQANDPIINGGSGTASCKQITIGTGTVTLANATGAILETYGNFSNSGVLNQNDGTLRITDAGAATNNSIFSTAAISSLTFNKTNGGIVYVGSTVMQINTLTFPASSNFTFLIGTGKTLQLPNGTTVTDATFYLTDGATLKLFDAQTFTVASGGTLRMVGISSSPAKMTSNAGSADYNVVINGSIEANYYNFDHLGVNGVSVESGATIDASNHLQNGSFTYPVDNSTTLLKLKRQVPTNAVDGMNFDLAGSAATSTTNIDTTGAASGTLTINSYTGDIAGAAFDTDPTYNISWTGALNTIDLTQEATSPTSVNAGSTYNMGRFGFEQTQPGSSYVDADITSLKLTLTGTANSSDIAQARIYYDSDCNGTAGTLVGTGTFSGSPLNKTFSFAAGDITVHADISTPPKRCVYVEYDFAAGAANNKTAGVKINAAIDIVNDQSYAIADSTPPPVDLGSASTIIGATTTDWTGSTSTDWFIGTNWSNGVPDATKACGISDVTNDPVINGGSGTAMCRNANIANGFVTMTNATSAVWEIHGNFENTGTLTQNDGTLRIEDGGSGSAQTVSSTSTLSALTFDKTTGGSVRVNSNMTINTLTFPGGANFEFQVPSTVTLTLPNGFSLPAATFNVESGGTVKIGNGQTVAINGGTFKTSGINDTASQSTANKGIMTIDGSGEWGFTATSGSVDLTGFFFKYLDVSGLNIGGSTTLTNLNGGQFTNLKTDWATPVRAIQINTSGSVPATANNIGWMWDGPNTSNVDSTNAPATTDNYYIVYAPNCGSNTITFDQWFGDFAPSADSPDTEDKIYDTDDGQTCQISVAASASPVSLLSLTATPYDSAISLDWETSAEIDHAGFNVYRSISPTMGYVQVNSQLIRNIYNSTSYHGVYRYVDSDVTNGTTYYYKIEDVAYNDAKEMHGPVHVRPDAGLGAAPPDPSETNSGISSPGANTGNGPNQGPITNSDVIDLGNGVHIIAQTEHSLRIEIDPPAATWTPSTWDASYEILSVPGFSTVTENGHPSIVERTVLIEVSDQNSNVTVTGIVPDEIAPASHKLEPVANWSPDGNGTLQPAYAENATAYAVNGYGPSQYIEVDNTIKTIGGKKYIQLKVTPFLYHPVSQLAKGASKITLDLVLDGQPAWDIQIPDSSKAQTPASIGGNLRIRYASSGLYKITFDDIDTTGLSGPFVGTATSDMRMYYHGTEISMDIDSATGNFASGDTIYFYAPYETGFEEKFDEVVLSTIDVLQSASPPMRMPSLNADPSGAIASSEDGTPASTTYEWNWGTVFLFPMGDLIDHFFMPLMYAFRGGEISPLPTHTYRDIPLEMPGLKQSSTQDVTLIVKLVARAQFAINATHHLGIYINNVPYLIDEQTFVGRGLHELVFQIPHSYFFAGTNNIRLRAMGDMVPVGDVEIINIDKVDAHYRSNRVATNGIANIFNAIEDSQLTIENFPTANVRVFDVSSFPQVSQLSNVSIAANGSTFDATFKANWVIQDDEIESGRHFLGIEAGNYMQPSELSMSIGSEFSLKGILDADLIVIGGYELLDAAEDLIAARRTQGLRVVEAPLDQIYAEYSNGLVSSQAIKDFLTHARNNWVDPKPKYLLILGDATYDPKDIYNYKPSRNTMPIPMQKGLYLDFGNDNWFVTDEGSNIPSMAVGRIPTSNAAEVYDFVTKLLDYESGDRAPEETTALNSVFVSDTSSKNEGFSRDSQTLAGALKASHPEFQTTDIERSEMTDAETRAQILSQFNNSPLLINYLGHGAEDRWASADVFDNDDASQLSNTRLPIVTALNCLNSMFYEADPSYKSLGEQLVLNPNGGAIAFWGSTTMTIPPVQVALATNFVNEIGMETQQTYHEVRLGDISLRAKTGLQDNGSTADTLRSWTLFGDPSMRLPASVFAKAKTTPSAPAAPIEEVIDTPAAPIEDVIAAPPTTDQAPAPVAAAPSSEGGSSSRGPFGCSGAIVLPPPGGGNGPPPYGLLLLLLPMLLLLPRRVYAKEKGRY